MGAMLLALIVLIPLLGAVLPLLAIRSGRNVCTLVTAAVSLSSLVVLLANGPAVYEGETIRGGAEWVPAIGLSFRFFVDGLGLFLRRR